MFNIYADGQSIYEPMDDRLTIHSPKLTLEMGKAGSLQFIVPPTNRYYSRFQQLKTIIVVELDDVEIFRGRVLTNNRNFNNMRTIYCEGNLAYLVDSVQRGEKFNGSTHDLFREIINRHNKRVDAAKQFKVGTINIENRNIILSGQSEKDKADAETLETSKFDYKQIVLDSIVDDWQTSFEYIESCLIDYCGGYLRTRRVGNTTYIDLVKDYGNTAVQKIEFGINLLDLNEEVSADDVFTVLIPLGDDNLTIASVNNGSDELVDSAAVERYGRIVKTHVFDNVNKASTLLENARRYMNSHENMPITLSVKAVDMHLLDRSVREIHVGDRVQVNSFPHNLSGYLTCTKIEYDLDNPANDVYTFGKPRQTMTERYRKDKAKAAKRGSRNSKNGGGAAGGAAGEEAQEAIEEELDKFFNAWINLDKEGAHIDLGTLYRELVNGKAVLESQCGISLDAPSGNINIKTFRSEFDDMEKAVKNQRADIDLLNEEQKAQIALVTARHNELAGQVLNHHAEMLAYVDDFQSKLDLNTERIATQEGEVQESNNRISLLSEELKSQILLEAQHHEQVNGEIRNSNAKIDQVASNLSAQITLEAAHKKSTDEAIASITIKANEMGSEIELKADKTTLNSKVTTINSDIVEINGKIKTINAEMAKIDSLISKKVLSTLLSAQNINAGRVRATSIEVGDNEGGYILINGSYAATRGWVENKKYVTESYLNSKGYLTALPDVIKVPTLSATNIYLGGYLVATQQWVKDYVTEALAGHTHTWASITGKPTKFTPASHKHKFSASTSVQNGHTHKVTVNGKEYTTGGVSANSRHDISISGTTENN